MDWTVKDLAALDLWLLKKPLLSKDALLQTYSTVPTFDLIHRI